MKKKYLFIALAVLIMLAASCKKIENSKAETEGMIITESTSNVHRSYTNFPEGFESGTKTSYSTGTVTLLSGSWNFNNALIGTSSSDRKTGAKSARMQSTGKLTMNFNVSNNVVSVGISHGKYGSDASSTWALYASTNSGSTWTKIGATITTSSTTLSTASFTMNYTVPVRFQIRKLSGGRLNIDDVNIDDGIADASRDDNLAMGNPSNAVANILMPDNYLMVKPQYVLSYNNTKGEANWVSWHLSTAWTGNIPRCDCFTADNTLPSVFFSATTSDYTNSGFDRGHMCPSADRNGTSDDNAATFLMTNIIPQAPVNNQQTWAYLEDYCRTLSNAGNELYIISGGYGSGGTGSLGGITYTIDGGNINVPSHVWKVILILPNGSDDVNRVTSATRVIAVDLPNNQTVNVYSWGYYRTAVDNIESITGYDFFSYVPVNIQTVIESVTDSGPTN